MCLCGGPEGKKRLKKTHEVWTSISKINKKTLRSRRHGRFWTSFCFCSETLLKNFRAAEIRIKNMLQKKKFFWTKICQIFCAVGGTDVFGHASRSPKMMCQIEEKKYLADTKIHTTFDNSSEHRSCQMNKNWSTIVRPRRYRGFLERSWKPQNCDSN